MLVTRSFPCRPPNPQKIQRRRRVTKKWPSGSRPNWLQKWLKSAENKSHFWVTFWVTLAGSRQGTFLSLWILGGLGACRGERCAQVYATLPITRALISRVSENLNEGSPKGGLSPNFPRKLGGNGKAGLVGADCRGWSGPIPHHPTQRQGKSRNCPERALFAPIGAFRAKPPFAKPPFSFNKSCSWHFGFSLRLPQAPEKMCADRFKASCICFSCWSGHM